MAVSSRSDFAFSGRLPGAADTHGIMLARLYVEALPVDEELADEVWGLWGKRMIDDELAAIA